MPWGKVREESPPVVASAPATDDAKPRAPATPGLDPAMVQIGQALFAMYRCAGCHIGNPAYPQLNGKYGKKVGIEGGDTETFDDDYIKESILAPNAKIAAGFKPVMPPYKDRITDDEIKQIILYIRSLK